MYDLGAGLARPENVAGRDERHARDAIDPIGDRYWLKRRWRLLGGKNGGFR